MHPLSTVLQTEAGSCWKDAEILLLRHQLGVAQRERPRAGSRLTWPEQAWLALLAETLPVGRLAMMRLIVAPGHDLAIAPRHRAVSVSACVASPLWPSSGAPQRAAHLMIVLREYEDFYNTHRPHRTLKQAAPLWPLPDTCPIWSISGFSGMTAPEA